MTKIKKYSQSALAALWLSAVFFAAPASATIIFQDNFDADSATSILNFNGFANWTVDNGTVDYIRNGGFGISCVGGAGGCVDLDGSTGNGGRMLSNTTFNFLANETYRITLDVSGNQRGGAADLFTFGLTGFITSLPPAIAFGDPFVSMTLGGFSQSGPYTGQLFVETTSADNIGVIIDNVLLECLTCGPSEVPEPGPLALLGLGLVGLGYIRRQRQH